MSPTAFRVRERGWLVWGVVAVTLLGAGAAWSADERAEAWARELAEAGDWQVVLLRRIAAADERSESVRDRVAPLLKSPDPEVCAAAASAFLAAGGDARAVWALRESGDARVRRAAYSALLRHGVDVDRVVDGLARDVVAETPEGEQIFERLTPGLHDAVVRRVGEALRASDRELAARPAGERLRLFEFLSEHRALDEAGVSRLVTLSHDFSPRQFEALLRAASERHAEQAEVRSLLRAGLSAASPEARRIAAAGLLKGAPRDADAWGVLRELLGHPEPDVVEAALESVGAPGLDPVEVLPETIALYLGPARGPRQRTVPLLRRIGPAVLPVLLPRLEAGEAGGPFPESVWESTEDLLRDWGPAARAAIPVLIERAAKGEPYTLNALCSVAADDPRLVTAAERLLAKGDPGLRRALYASLYHHSPTSSALRRDLLTVVEAAPGPEGLPERLECRCLRLRLGARATAVAAELAAELVGDREELAVAEAEMERLIGELGPAAADAKTNDGAPLLRELAGVYDGGVVYRAGAGALPYLVERLGDPRASVRVRACEGLAELGAAARPAVPAVVAMLEAESPSAEESAEVAWAALDLLDQFPEEGRAALPRLVELHRPPRSRPLDLLWLICRYARPGEVEYVPLARPWQDADDLDEQWAALRAILRIDPEDPQMRQFYRESCRRYRESLLSPDLWGGLEGGFSKLLSETFGHPAVAAEVRPELEALWESSLLRADQRCELAYHLARLYADDPRSRRYLVRVAADDGHAKSLLKKLDESAPTAPGPHRPD